ncbi:hypothetical protein KDX31_06940 [Amphritea atlantica]|uniref:Uncharacterized protein n=1 Tax=Amphritea atlantica TaxID=355243 RepID=A0ABY5GXI5_9GAMM|nr:hypothetical protein KDX31_06940 [Amphritea atlantica]
MSDQFKVVFSGNIVEGFEPETVITAFSEKFRCSEAKARALVLAGKATVIKSDLDKAKAEKYCSVLTAMGLEAEQVAQQPVVKPALAWELEGDESADDTDAPAGDAFASGFASSKNASSEHLTSEHLTSEHSASGQAPSDKQSSGFDYSSPASSANPYQAPQADLSQEYEEGDLSGPDSVPASHGWSWLVGGFGHFKQNPVAWIVAIVIWVIVSTVLSMIPLVGSIGVTILSPVIGAGFMLGCRSQEEGGDFRIAHLFSGFSNNVGQLMLVGLLYMVSVIVVVVGIVMFAGGAVFMMGGGNPDNMGPGMLSAMILPMLIGALFIIPIVMAYWFAPALVALNGISAITAMKMSFSACLKNIVPGLVYSIIAAVLLIIAAIPFGLGLLVLIPMLAASMYTSYRDIFYN